MYWFAFPALRPQSDATVEACRSVGDVLSVEEQQALAAGVGQMREGNGGVACFMMRRGTGDVVSLAELQPADFDKPEDEVRQRERRESHLLVWRRCHSERVYSCHPALFMRRLVPRVLSASVDSISIYVCPCIV